MLLVVCRADLLLIAVAYVLFCLEIQTKQSSFT